MSTPPSTAALLAAGLQHHARGDWNAAEPVYRQILDREPQHAEALHLLGTVALHRGQPETAVELIGQALRINPAAPHFYNNLALAHQALGQYDAAIASFRRALELRPAFVSALANLGDTLRRAGKLEEAGRCLQEAHRLEPAGADILDNLGTVLGEQGRLDEAITCRRQALTVQPGFVQAHCNLLATLQYHPQSTLATLARAHAEFQTRHAAPLRSLWRPHANDRDPRRALRVGFVSPQFARQPVGCFLVRVLENLDPQQCRAVCYSDCTATDAMTDRLRRAAWAWRDVFGWNDERLADEIRNEQIDILFDLAGHTGGNRLLVFARRPAPLQITWLDYEGTTGLEAMDYLLADPHLVPPDAERWYCERVLRMPDDFVCFDPPAEAPPVNRLPALARGSITFGSFNYTSKITPPIVAVWSRILQRVAGSRLLLKYRGLDDPGTVARFRQLFAACDAPQDRIEFQGWSPYAEFLATYHQVDIALDTFPYHGGLTTCEALWMGVPVIACPGATFASRHAVSHLSAVGITEMLAANLDDYVEKAVTLAGDRPRLTELRATLRPRVAASPLCDGRRFATRLTAVLRDIWQRWTETQRG